MARKQNRTHSRHSRHLRVRKKVTGTAERPRLSVFRSLRQVYAQVIDDSTGRTIVAASSLSLKQNGASMVKTQAAAAVGKQIAEAANKAGVTRVIFDRGGYKYHGRVKALADAAREGGLEF